MLKIIKKYPITLIGLVVVGYSIVISLLNFQYEDPCIRRWLLQIALWNPIFLFARRLIPFDIPDVYHIILLVVIVFVMGFALDVLFRKIWPILKPIKKWIYITIFAVLICLCFFLYENSISWKRTVYHFAEISGRQIASNHYKSGTLRLYKVEYSYNGKSSKNNPSGEMEGQLEVYYVPFILVPIFDGPEKYGLEVWVEAHNDRMKELVKFNGSQKSPYPCDP